MLSFIIDSIVPPYQTNKQTLIMELMRQTDLSCRRGGDFWLTREVSLKHRFSNLSKLFRFCQDQLSLIDSETFQHLHNYFELLRKFTNFVVLGSRFLVITPSERNAALYHTDDRSALSTVLTVLRKRLRHLF